MNIDLIFQNWQLVLDGANVRQFDDGAQVLSVTGERPEGWRWRMDIAVYGRRYFNSVPLTESDGALTAVLTRDDLAFGDTAYTLQLVGEREGVTRHTNPVRLYVGESICGDAVWPEVPASFTAAQRASEAAAAVAEAAAVRAAWSAENLGIEYMTSEDIDELWESTDGVPAASGSVATPEMFGAKGDGVTDDTAAIQAAIDSGAGLVRLRPGASYLVSKAGNQTLYPNGDEPCLYISGKTGLQICGSGATLKVHAHGQGILEIIHSSNVLIDRLNFLGHGSFPAIDQTGRGEKGDASGGYYKSGYDWESHKNNSVDTSKFKGVNGNADTEWGTFGGGYIGNAAIGVLIDGGSKNVTLRGCASGGFNYAAFSVGFRGNTSPVTNEDIRFAGCRAYNCYDGGFNVLMADGVRIEGCVIEDMGHPDARPVSAAQESTHAVLDPGYGVVCRKVGTSDIRAKNVTVENCTIRRCVRKGIDSHGGDGLVVKGSVIELCYVSGVEISAGDTETSLTRNVIVGGNTLRNCGLYGHAIDMQIYTGSPSFDPDDCDINFIVQNNLLVDCACNSYGMIWTRISRNTIIADNIISGMWSLADMSLLSAIYAGQADRTAGNIMISGNQIRMADVNYPIHAQNLVGSMIDGNTAYVGRCNVLLYAHGDHGNDVSVVSNVMRADSYAALPAYSTTTANCGGNSFSGLLKTQKRISGEYTVSSGFFRVTDSAVLPASVLVISQKYSNGTAVGVLFAAQCGDGYANIYVRNPDGTIPADGSIVAVNMLVVNE